MGYEMHNRENVLAEVEKLIAKITADRDAEVEKAREEVNKYYYSSWYRKKYIRSASRKYGRVRMWDVCEPLSIFDWWNDYLSLSQLKQMRSFLITAGKLGFNGYVCFKVGAVGCANGMWACKHESTNGYSPKGETIYHSFVCNENYWGYCTEDDEWIREDDKYEFTLKEIKEQMKEARKKGAVA